MAYVPLATVDRTTFRWQRTADSPIEFTLSSGDLPVAHLTWAHPGGSLATLHAAEGSWTLERGGFLHPHIAAHQGPGGQALARLSVHLSHHAIEIRGGTTYRFHRAGLLVPAWKVASPEGAEILHIEPVREGRKLQGGAVLVAPAATTLPELLLLVVLSWHFIVLAWFEDEALVPLEGT